MTPAADPEPSGGGNPGERIRSGQAAVEQRITVVAGYGYGVIGADLHVFGDGLPLYLLENYRPAGREDPDRLAELPSRMLDARFAVVAFTGRAGELRQLEQWRDGRPRLALRWPPSSTTSAAAGRTPATGRTRCGPSRRPSGCCVAWRRSTPRSTGRSSPGPSATSPSSGPGTPRAPWRRRRRPSAPGHTAPGWPDGAPQQTHLDFAVEDLAAADRAATDAGATRLRPTEEPGSDTGTGSRVYASPAGHPFCLRAA